MGSDQSREQTFIRRSLEENRFWLRIMKEHSLFLSEGFDRRSNDLIAQANAFFRLFDDLLQRARAFDRPSAETIFRFNRRVIRATNDLRNFKQEVLIKIIRCQIAGFNLPLLVDHIRREAEYLITVLTKLNEGIDEPIAAEIVRENVFWLRIMAEHSRFIEHLLDPSERSLIRQTRSFAREFEQLLAQARDLDSMVEGASPVLVVVGGHFLDRPTIIRLREEEEQEREFQRLLRRPPPVLQRFNEEVIAATSDLRDFKATATVLLRQCKVLSVINPLLADHVTREAEHFLSVLNELEGRLERKTDNTPALEVTRPAPPCRTAR